MQHVWAIALLLASLSGGNAVAQDQNDERAPLRDYEVLTQWRYQVESIPVPQGGIGWREDTAAWQLDSGRIRLQEPTSGGAVTGMVFQGSGRFRMTVPDPFELAQLRRFAQEGELEEIDVAFSQLVLRTSGELPVAARELPATPPFAPHPVARERHELWLRSHSLDADARILAAQRTPGDRYLRIAIETDAFGWLVYEFDAQRREEIRLEKQQPGRLDPGWSSKLSFYESWLSLATERDSRGRPVRRPEPALDLRHVDLVVDLTRPGRDHDEMKARVRATVDFTARHAGARVLPFYLHPRAKVKSVTDAAGRALGFLRHHVGARSSALDRRHYDDSLLILLAEPVVAVDERRLVFAYEIDLRHPAPEWGWYPRAEDEQTGPVDLHTARLELTVRRRYELWATGTKVDERIDGRRKTFVFRVGRPVRDAAFWFAKWTAADRLTVEGGPEVVAFATRDDVQTSHRCRIAAARVGRSIELFGRLFDSELAGERILAAATAAEPGPGRAAEGFLLLPRRSFDGGHPEARMLDLAHGAAGQWWGHKVGWEGYRDLWLSEALAEYSAMLFVEAAAENGARHFREILRLKTEMLRGRLHAPHRPYARRSLTEFNPVRAARIGPLGHGSRARTDEVSQGDELIFHAKGPLVVHMLRWVIRSLAEPDETFFRILRDFVATYDGGAASTEDFQAIVAKHVPADWSWFFDQWVYGAAIPTYAWSYQVGPAAGGRFELTLRVAQTGVPAEFRMPVPVRLELAGGKTQELTVMVDEPRESFTFDLPAEPVRVIFNPDFAVLARMRGGGSPDHESEPSGPPGLADEAAPGHPSARSTLTR